MDRITEQTLCDLQAQLYVQRIALCALARAHPDPDAVLSAWRAALADAASDPVVAAHAQRSEFLAERCQAFAEDWTAELVELAVPRQPR